jgi:hypothetical protein
LNSELDRYAGCSFYERLLVLLISFIWWEKCRKNGEIVLSYVYARKVTNKKVECYRGIILFNACYKLYSKILKEELKAQAGISFQ